MHLSKRVGNYQWSSSFGMLSRAMARRRRTSGRSSAFAPATQKPAQAFADGIGFAFGTTPNPRLFLTNHIGSGLLRDLTGKTLTATLTITGTAPRSPLERARRRNACGTPASVRVYFEGKPPPGGHKAMVVDPAGIHPDEPDRPYHHVDGSGPHGELADGGSQLASDVPTDFAAAVAKVRAVGVSFGGGCFLPTGAFPTDVTTSFVLKSYSVS